MGSSVVRRVRALDYLLGGALALAVADTFAPWLRSGSSQRTSYQVVRAAKELELLGGRWESVIRAVWSFMPFLAAVALVAVVLGRTRPGAGLAVVVGAMEAVLALVVMKSPRSADWGARAGLAVGLALVAIAMATAWTMRSRT